jgi:hypothetical protein
MLYFQMPLYFFLGALFYLFPDAGASLLAGYIGLSLWARRNYPSRW